MKAHDHTMPPGALAVIGGVLALTIIAASAPRLGLTSPPKTLIETRVAAGLRPLAEREVRFSDGADGAVVVDDAKTGARITSVAPGHDKGFVRGVVRSLARERHARGIGPQAPFRLTSWPGGALSLTDTATGRTLELKSFGPTNRDAFAVFLGGTV